MSQTGRVHSHPDADEQRMLRALLLLQAYTRGLSTVAARTLVEAEAPNADVGILVVLHMEGPQGPSVLADGLGLDRSRASRLLRDLQRRGLVARESDPGDGRRATISLTPRGKERVVRLEPALKQYFADSTPLVRAALDLLESPTSTEGTSTEGVPAVDALAAALGLSAAGDRFVAKGRAALRPFGVSDDSDERFILGLLSAYGTRRPGWLAEELERPAAFVSIRLGRLERAGLIVRELGADGDARAVRVSLSIDGRRAARAYLQVFVEEAPSIAAAVAATLTAIPQQSGASSGTPR